MVVRQSAGVSVAENEPTDDINLEDERMVRFARRYHRRLYPGFALQCSKPTHQGSVHLIGRGLLRLCAIQLYGEINCTIHFQTSLWIHFLG